MENFVITTENAADLPESFPQIRLENVKRSTKKLPYHVREFYQFYLQPKAD